MNKFVTKDSGRRESFDSGAVRDTSEEKPRYDLIPPHALTRLAHAYRRGALKYKEHNWTLGMPFARFYESAYRHLMQFSMGDKSEDHLSAAIFNLMAIMHFQEIGRADLDNMYEWSKKINEGEKDLPARLYDESKSGCDSETAP